MHDDNPWSKEAEENAPRKQSNVTNMTWKTGEATIRVMPPIKKGALPFVKYIVHWIPVKTGRYDRPIIHAVDYRCPVCEFVSTLWSEVYRLKDEEDMTDKSPEVQKLIAQIGKLRGKKTYDMNIIHREDAKTDDGKVKIKRLVAGPTIWKSIIELGNSDKWGNPSTATDRGYDLTVTVDGEGKQREYTILPDPNRKALTKAEVEALAIAYDLAKLRVFSTPKEIVDLLMVAKAPLDSINIKKIKKELLENSSDDSKTSTDDDDDDDDVTPPAKVETDDDDDEADTKVAKDDKKEEKAFAKDDDDDDDVKEPTTPEVSSDDDDDSTKLSDMDCRGTYDGDDMGCRECKLVDDCKTLKKEFKAKVEQYAMDVDGMSGVEIEKAIKEKEKSKPIGKQGKSGKVGSSNEEAPTQKKRVVPF